MKNLQKTINFKNMIFIFCIVFVLLLGIFIRTFALQHSDNLFADEFCLISNIISRNYFELFLPLDTYQCSPPLFLILGKIFFTIFGYDNIGLRILPYIYSVLSLISFTFLSFKIIKNKIGKLLSILSFSISEWCIFQQMFFKQYISDIFFTTVVLLLAILLKDKKLSKSKLFVLGILSCLIVFFSYTAGFIILCTLIVFCIKNIFESKSKQEIKEKFKLFLYYMIPFSIIMAIFFFVNCLPAINNEFLQEFWNTNISYAYFLPKKYAQIKEFFQFFTSPFGRIYPSMFIFVSTIILLTKKDKFLCGILYLPFVLAIALGYFKLYPLSPERLCLYLIPIFILILFKPLDFISLKKKALSLFIILPIFLNINYKKIFTQYVQFLNGKAIYVINDYKYRYKKEKITLFPQFIDILYHSDITPNDYFIRDYASGGIIDEKYSSKINYQNMKWDEYSDFKDLETIPKNSNVYLYISKEYHFDYDQLKEWINKNCTIIYNIKCYNAEFIKCKKIR